MMLVIPEVINTILMGLIFMVIVITIVRPLMLNLVKEYAGPSMQDAIIEEIELKIARRAEKVAQHRAQSLEFHRLLALPPPSLYALPAPAESEHEFDDDEDELETIESELSEEEQAADQDTALVDESQDGQTHHDSPVDGQAGAEQEVAEGEETPGESEIEIREGETLADIKARLKKEKESANKQTIPPELLNNAKSYEDKVGVVRMVVEQDHSRVAAVIRSMIQIEKK
jgi:hypothetical protein